MARRRKHAVDAQPFERTLPTLEEYVRAKAAALLQPCTILPFHRLMYETITAWATGDLPDGKRHLAICMPPRHGKTMTAHSLIEWLTGIFPDSKWLYTSYSANLAVAQTVIIRDNLASDWYQRIFPWVTIKPGNARQDKLVLTSGGELYGVGMTGTVTGFGAGQKRKGFSGGIVVDDALSSDDARSQTKRQHVNEWYSQTLKSRRNSDKTPIICIMQRLHTEDLIAHVQATEGDQWHVLSIPAMDEHTGEMLWPETFSRESAERLKAVDPYTYYAQYQQEPQIPGGGLIKAKWWQDLTSVGDLRTGGMLIITADTAYKATSSADASVLQLWSLSQQHLDLIDGMSGRWEFPELLAAAGRFYKKWREHGVKYFYVEDKASGASLEQTLRSHGIPGMAWRPMDFDFPESKVSRVHEASWAIAGGHVRVRMGTEAADKLIEESSRFQVDMSHAHDDHVDAMTMAVSIWRYAGGGRVPLTP